VKVRDREGEEKRRVLLEEEQGERCERKNKECKGENEDETFNSRKEESRECFQFHAVYLLFSKFSC
jgi:hypothetical protein